MIEQAQLGTVTAYITNDPVTGQPLMLQTSTGTVSLYVYSGNNGSPVGLITDAGIQSYSYEFDPYGTPVLTAGGTGNGISQNPFLFQGGIQDRATGWVKFGARWYNPTTGRWTQQDTLDNPLDPNVANRYAYAGNDPINNIDPSGRGVGSDIANGLFAGYFGAEAYDILVHHGNGGGVPRQRDAARRHVPSERWPTALSRRQETFSGDRDHSYSRPFLRGVTCDFPS